jgi:predicted metalloprotease with PDZ domain
MIRQQRSLVLMLGVVLALAVNASLACADAGDKKESKSNGQPFVGVRVGEVEDEQGVVVGQVVADGPAAKAGLKNGDIITRVDGREIDSPDTLQNVLAKHKPGETLNFHVKRNGKEKMLKVTLGKAPKEPAIGRNEPSEEGPEGAPNAPKKHAFLGVQAIPVDELTPRLKRRLGITAEDGLVVMEVVPDSPAAKSGLEHGDVITQINGKEITGIEDLIKNIRKTGVGKTVHLNVLRGKEKKSMDAKLEASPVGGLGMMPMGRFFPGGELGGGGPGRFPLGPMEAERKIERLERRVQELEKRIQELESRRSGTEKKSDKNK